MCRATDVRAECVVVRVSCEYSLPVYGAECVCVLMFVHQMNTYFVINLWFANGAQAAHAPRRLHCKRARRAYANTNASGAHRNVRGVVMQKSHTRAAWW